MEKKIKEILKEDWISIEVENFRGNIDLFELSFNRNRFHIWKNGKIISSTFGINKLIIELFKQSLNKF